MPGASRPITGTSGANSIMLRPTLETAILRSLGVNLRSKLRSARRLSFGSSASAFASRAQRLSHRWRAERIARFAAGSTTAIRKRIFESGWKTGAKLDIGGFPGRDPGWPAPSSPR